MNVGERHAESVWVMGAGSVGCWVGGRLAGAGARVHFIGRPRVVEVRRTEGEVVRLARAHGLAAPRNARMVQLLDGRWPEAPPLMTAGELWSALKRA